MGEVNDSAASQLDLLASDEMGSFAPAWNSDVDLGRGVCVCTFEMAHGAWLTEKMQLW